MMPNIVNLANLHTEKEEKLICLTVSPVIAISIFQKERPRFPILETLLVT